GNELECLAEGVPGFECSFDEIERVGHLLFELRESFATVGEDLDVWEAKGTGCTQQHQIGKPGVGPTDKTACKREQQRHQQDPVSRPAFGALLDQLPEALHPRETLQSPFQRRELSEVLLAQQRSEVSLPAGGPYRAEARKQPLAHAGRFPENRYDQSLGKQKNC